MTDRKGYKLENEKLPILYIVIPCYNEEKVLPVTSPLFLKEVQELEKKKKISEKSRILYVDDGSTDTTWELIKKLAEKNKYFVGISQSRNRGHQNAVLAGLMEAMDMCDITISIDCDGQDDIQAIEAMVDAYKCGNDIVYGVRSDRNTDSYMKRTTAELFYGFLNLMGVECVSNHADYRLISSKALQSFAEFKEVNLFLRGLIPLVGYKSTKVFYERKRRMAGESHYPLRKMLALAIDGITSLSIRPIRIVTGLGFIVSIFSFIGIIWSIIAYISGNVVTGWASMVCIICFMGGVQLLSFGIIGEYIGKIYLETKRRPRYIISERTWEKDML